METQTEFSISYANIVVDPEVCIIRERLFCCCTLKSIRAIKAILMLHTKN